LTTRSLHERIPTRRERVLIRVLLLPCHDG